MHVHSLNKWINEWVEVSGNEEKMALNDFGAKLLDKYMN